MDCKVTYLILLFTIFGFKITFGQTIDRPIINTGGGGSKITNSLTGTVGQLFDVILTSNSSVVTQVGKVSQSIMNYSNVIIFPIPVKEQLNVTIKSVEKGHLYIKIIDLQGKEVYRTEFFKYQSPEFTSIIDIHNLSSGLYIIDLHSDNALISFKDKFIKQ